MTVSTQVPAPQVQVATPIPADRRTEQSSHHPVDLMARRPDLYGVCSLADVTADSVLWSA